LLSTKQVDNKSKAKNPHLICLVETYLKQFFDLFPYLNINEQKRPIELQKDKKILYSYGFPLARKKILCQFIELLYLNNYTNDAKKFEKYLLHEFTSYLDKEESDHLIKSILENENKNERDVDNSSFKKNVFNVKFYNLPSLKSLKITKRFGKIKKINQKDTKQEKGGARYIYYFENPLISNKKQTIYNLCNETFNRIDLTMSNPIQSELLIDRIQLIAESNVDNSDKLLFDLKQFDDENNQISPIKIPASEDNFELKLAFKPNCLGAFKIIGYEIVCLKFKSEILFENLLLTSSNKNNNINNSTDNNSIQSSYNIEVIPNLAVIKEIQMFSFDINQNLKEVHCSLYETEKTSQVPIIEYEIGTR
jgi:hypothetical protein